MKSVLYLFLSLICIPGISYSAEMVYCLTVDKSIDGAVYASTYGGGLWKADKDLFAWGAKSSGLSTPLPTKYHTILCTAIAPSNSAIMYCGNTSGRVYHSADRGNTWVNTGLNLLKVIRALAIDPFNAGHIYVASERGLYEQKRGSTWQMVLAGGNRIFQDVAFDPFDNRIIYAVAQNDNFYSSLFTSRDAGITWTETILKYGTGRIGLDPKHEGIMYISSRGGVLKTEDDGATWDFFSNGLDDSFVTAIIVDPADPQVVYAGTLEGLYISEDGGRSWSNTGIIDGWITDLAFSRDENSLYIGTGNHGILKQALTE
jgi:photosystem II stability/assembly factor-like uncharacterized protein